MKGLFYILTIVLLTNNLTFGQVTDSISTNEQTEQIQSNLTKKKKKYNFDFTCQIGINVFENTYRFRFWKNIGFFSNFYFAPQMSKYFKLKNNYFFGLTASVIYFQNNSKLEIGNENDKSYYLKSNYYLNNKLLFVGLNLKKNWQLNRKFKSGFYAFTLNSNIYSNTKFNGSTIEYYLGNFSGSYPYAETGSSKPVQNNGWLKNKTIKSNLMYGLMLGIKSKFNKTPLCFNISANYSRQFPNILMSSYSILFGITASL